MEIDGDGDGDWDGDGDGDDNGTGDDDGDGMAVGMVMRTALLPRASSAEVALGGQWSFRSHVQFAMGGGKTLHKCRHNSSPAAPLLTSPQSCSCSLWASCSNTSQLPEVCQSPGINALSAEVRAAVGGGDV